jgi:putative transposase
MRAKTKSSERRACVLIGLSHTVLHYAPCARLTTISCGLASKSSVPSVAVSVIAGIHALLRREGLSVNVKRVHRLYCEDGLQVRRRRRHRGVAIERRPLLVPQAPSEVWSMDFVMNALEHGRRLKCLTIVDDLTREAIDIIVDHGISGQYITRVLDQAGRFRELPKVIRTDQGIGKALDQ